MSNRHAVAVAPRPSTSPGPLGVLEKILEQTLYYKSRAEKAEERVIELEAERKRLLDCLGSMLCEEES